MSKNGSKLFFFDNSNNYVHYAVVKSQPVGLWAQAWNNITDPFGAFERSSTIPVKSTPRVFGSKYLYSENSNPAILAILWWFGHVGFGTNTLVPYGKNFLQNSNPSLTAPVPLNT